MIGRVCSILIGSVSLLISEYSIALADDCSSASDCRNVIGGSGILAMLLAVLLAQTLANASSKTIGEKVKEVHYDCKVVTLRDADGNVLKEYPATSGRDGVTDTSVRDKGPIPEGTYTMDPKDISQATGIKGWIRKWLGDWGDYRVTLKPDPGTDTKGRDGFFIHGGEKPGSAGCIDVGAGDKSLFPILKHAPGQVKVVVDCG
jgi:hypothetical protein